MSDTPDADLLEQFVSNESEAAFAGLVERHIALVHSVALRHTANPEHAQDITQAVFVILARKARSLGRKTVLPGWLYHTARLTAANLRRSEQCRIRREQEAFMQSSLEETASEKVWSELSPLLDDAMGRLGAADRDAIVLRYFQNKSLLEVGQALGLEERAAQKRVSRALEKLRTTFTRRGVTLTATLIAGAVSANSVLAAPVGLAATIAVTAAKGSAVAASTLTLVEGVLKFMAWTKAKTVLVTGAIILVAGTTTVLMKKTAAQARLTPQEIAVVSQSTYASLSSYSDTGKVVSKMGDQTWTTTFKIKLQRPDLYRIDWTQTGGMSVSKGSVWSAGDGDYFLMTVAGQEGTAKPEKQPNMQMALASATGVSGSAAATIPGTFFKQAWGDALGVAASGWSQPKRESDGSIGGVDCFVVSSVIDPAKLPGKGKSPGDSAIAATTTTTLWIGKRDYLIHQTLTAMEGGSVTQPEVTDAVIKSILERQNKAVTAENIAAMRGNLETSMKQAQSAMKSGKIVFTQTHENIAVNKKFSASDFAP